MTDDLENDLTPPLEPLRANVKKSHHKKPAAAQAPVQAGPARATRYPPLPRWLHHDHDAGRRVDTPEEYDRAVSEGYFVPPWLNPDWAE
jgi:hypothetical protein